ncbi:MAG TPA: sigma factor [Candidatus Dormibacteraeota bacterium]|nr:sigma factor [Candidatus Dormibacteraeota bacterium]
MPTTDRGGEIERSLREQAAAFGRFSEAEERDHLARRDDPEAAERLVEHNLDLVAEQADGHAGQGLSFGDLYQEGAVGLLDAVAAYNGTGSFRQFASLHIGLQMDALIEAEGEARKEDQQMVEDVRAMDLAQTMFHQRERRDPTDVEMAKLLGWDAERVAAVRHQLDQARERNDALTLAYLDPAASDELGVDFLPEADPRRQLPGAGPDE